MNEKVLPEFLFPFTLPNHKIFGKSKYVKNKFFQFDSIIGLRGDCHPLSFIKIGYLLFGNMISQHLVIIFADLLEKVGCKEVVADVSSVEFQLSI